MERSKTAITIAIIFLVIWHQVGVIGLHIDETREFFQSLIPVNIIVSLGILGVFHRVWNMQFGLFIFAIFWAGYLIELIGLHSGIIFGNYSYGSSLGFKVSGVPPLIGLNWLFLVYITGIIAQKASSTFSMRIILGAGLMVILDMLIEPMAMEYDMWTWADERVPILNYFGWFVVSAAMQFAFHQLHQEKSNPIAYPMYLIQIAFFATFLVVSWA